MFGLAYQKAMVLEKWTSFTKPHPPFDPCFNYWSLYQNRDVPDPVYGDWSQALEDVPQGYLYSTYNLNNAYRLSPEQMKDVKRAYYACITQIDYTLGLLLARMRELGLFENTWIIFTTDHGDMMGDHHLGAKSVFFEGSAHIPLIIRPPHGSWEIHPMSGKKCDNIVTLADIMPTILKIAGIDIPDDIDGIDLMTQIENPETNRTFYGNCNNRHFAVIDGDYKYMWTALGGAELLFNLKEDPYEQRNLTNDPSHKDILDSLRQKLIQHLEKNNSDLVRNGKLIHKEAPNGPQDVPKWPGFHSTVYPTDVLH